MAIKCAALSCILSALLLCTITTEGRPDIFLPQHHTFHGPMQDHGLLQMQMQVAHQQAIHQVIQQQQHDIHMATHYNQMQHRNYLQQENMRREMLSQQQLQRWQEQVRQDRLRQQQLWQQRQQQRYQQQVAWDRYQQQQQQQQQHLLQQQHRHQQQQPWWNQQTQQMQRQQEAHAMAEVYRQHYNHMINQYNYMIQQQQQQQFHDNRIGQRFRTVNEPIYQAPTGATWRNYFGIQQPQVNRQAEQFSSQLLTDLQTGRVTQQEVSSPNFFLDRAMNTIATNQSSLVTNEEEQKPEPIATGNWIEAETDLLQSTSTNSNENTLLPVGAERPKEISAAADVTTTTSTTESTSKDSSNSDQPEAEQQDSEPLSNMIITYNPAVQRYEYVQINEPIRQSETNL